MRNLLALLLTLAFLSHPAAARQTATPAAPPPQDDDDDLVRITSALVQTDVVVTDKNERIVPDLKIEDFELYENGKRQEIKFLEFVSVETGRRVEGANPAAALPETDLKRDMTAADLKRVIAFVVDDLTIQHADLTTVRQVLRNFVDNRMMEGDLVAIVRVVGGKGMLQQFTSDKQLLRRAIATLNVSTNPFSAFDNPAQDRIERTPMPFTAEGIEVGGPLPNDNPVMEIPNDSAETSRLFRGLISLATANYVIESLKQLPGHKSLVLFSGGSSIFEPQSTGTIRTNVTEMLNTLTDNAVRAGVSISTMDPRGLSAVRGVVDFRDKATQPRSGLSEAPATNFGRGGADVFGPLLLGAGEQLSLRVLADNTGGVPVVNTNDFKAGLDRILARSSGYYLLAYTPTDKFDNKFRQLRVRVKRDGLKVYGHRGYVAKDEREGAGGRTKEQAILAASRSPLARRDIEVNSNLIVRFSPNNRAALDIDLVIDPRKLTFTQASDGKHQASFDVVGFVYDQVGKLRGSFSETVNVSMTPENYKRAFTTGIPYSANTDLPPGYYQVRTVVREAATGNMGTTSRYLEIPNLKEGRLAMSSILLYGVEAAKGASAQPQLLGPLREIPRSQELRYAATVYNAKREGSKHQLRSQIIISQGDRILFREPEQPLTSNSGDQQVTRIGQIGLSKVPPGRYVLTLIVTDPLADKKSQRVIRSTEFNVIS